MKAVIMAGGEGSRLRPVTASRPKPLAPVLNKPIMQYIVELLAKHGITDIVSTLHYLADEIQGYFDDGSEFGVKMSYSIEDTPLGTAGSVKKAQEFLEGEPFVIISGDALTDCDLSKAIAFHKERKSLATLVLYRVASPLDFGVVITDPDGKIIRFLEKPSWSEVFSDTVNTGIYILEPEILEMMEQGKQYDWSHDIFPRLLREGKPIYGYVMEEYWCDIGTLEQYRESQEDVLARRVDAKIDGVATENAVWLQGDVTISPEAIIIPPVMIGRNCKIKAGAKIGPYTVLGENCLIETGATVERSVIWEGTYLGPNVTVRSAIVGARATIKRESVISEDAVIGDRCLIDTGSTIRPRIKLWPDKVIERGSIVTMSLIWGHKWRGNLFRELGVAGLSNIEITPEYATRLGSAFGSVLPDRSTVVASRDSTRSSRMIKRAVAASLLSVGCEVIDLQSTAVPVARHYIRSIGAAGAVNIRKLPGNARVTLIEFFDGLGNYLPKNLERKVETAFFREDFHRVDPEDLGAIEYASHAIDDYQSAFYRHLSVENVKFDSRIVCDFGYSSISSFFPAMAGRLGLETININSYNDAKRAPRSASDIERHTNALQEIVSTLGYAFGVLFTDEGERLTLVTREGEVLDGYQLLAVLATLVTKSQPGAKIVLNVVAPEALEQYLVGLGAQVVRSKADTRSLMADAMKPDVAFGGDCSGGYIFPGFHPGFDAMFALARISHLLTLTGASLSEVLAGIPKFHISYEQVRCPWESKGSVMRKLTEDFSQSEDEVDMTDGISIQNDGQRVLVLPDSFEPVFHVFAESEGMPKSEELTREYMSKIQELQATDLV